MTGPQFNAWLRAHQLAPVDVATALRVGLSTVYRWRTRGTPHHIDIALGTLDRE